VNESGAPPTSPLVEDDDLPPTMARFISDVLRYGVAISALLGVLGLALLLSGPASVFSAATEHGAPFSAHAFVEGLFQGHAVDILLLGFMVLIATPLARVVTSVVMFARVRDRPFTILTLTVLVLLGASVVVLAFT
jgi:uncharacterized membrane protein